MKQLKMDSGDSADQALCMSPNGCCVAFGIGDYVFLFDCGRFITNSEYCNDVTVCFLMMC